MENPETPKAVREQIQSAAQKHEVVTQATHGKLDELAAQLKKRQEEKMERGNVGMA